MKFPTEQEFAKIVAEKAMDEYVIDGKTLRQWIAESIEIRNDRDYWKAEVEKMYNQLMETEKDAQLVIGELQEKYDALEDGANNAYGMYHEYKDAEEQGLLIKQECKIWDTVYIIEQCKDIPEQLDGTMYDSNGGYGTATGYYCPYQDRCPYDTDDCGLEADKRQCLKIQLHP